MKVILSSRLEVLLGNFILALILPVNIVIWFLNGILFPFLWFEGKTKYSLWKVGNYLLRNSWEAKNGQIRNKAILRNWTAYDYVKKAGGSAKKVKLH